MNKIDNLSFNEDDIDMNKDLNSKCSCGTGLPWIKDNIIMLYPCEHMLHEKCYIKYRDNSAYTGTISTQKHFPIDDRSISIQRAITRVIKNKKGEIVTKPNNIIDEEYYILDNTHFCPICHKSIEKIFMITDEDLHHQRFADMLSISYYDNMSYNSPVGFIDSMFDFLSIFIKSLFASNSNDGRAICEKIFSLNNLTLKVHGLDKIKLEKKKVYICNHVSQLELFILYYLLGTGFLASVAVNKDSFLMERVRKVVPLLTFNRGPNKKDGKMDIVEEMKKFVNKRGSICLFPEGIMKHPDALIKFRSGAFHIGYPVYSIVIRHNDIISDNYVNNFLYKLCGKKNLNIEVFINGPYYPPFDNNSIEKIRSIMAKKGNMILSRVSNRDIIDK